MEGTNLARHRHGPSLKRACVSLREDRKQWQEWAAVSTAGSTFRDGEAELSTEDEGDYWVQGRMKCEMVTLLHTGQNKAG